MASLVLQHVPQKARRILLIIGSTGLTYAEGSSTKLREALNAGALSVPEFLAYFGDQSSKFRLVEIPYERIQHFRIRLSDGAVQCKVVDESGQLLRIKTAIEDPELRRQAIVLLTENLT